MALQLVREVWKNARTGEEGERWIEMDVRTPEEQAAIDAQEAQQAADEASTQGALESQADGSLADLRAYRDAASPTNAQTVAIAKVLCRVCIALVRLHLRRLDEGVEAAGGK